MIRLRFEHFEEELPFNRMHLYERIEFLAEQQLQALAAAAVAAARGRGAAADTTT